MMLPAPKARAGELSVMTRRSIHPKVKRGEGKAEEDIFGILQEWVCEVVYQVEGMSQFPHSVLRLMGGEGLTMGAIIPVE